MMKRWAFSVVFVLTTVIVLAINLSGWRKGDWRVEWSCAAALVAVLGWAAVRFAGRSPQPNGQYAPLRGIRVKVTVWDVPEPYWNIREAAARALEALLAADGADVRVHGGKGALPCELEVLDIALEHRAGSVSLTGGRDSPQDRYSMMVRLIGPNARASGTRAISVNVSPATAPGDIGKRFAYDTARRLGVLRSVDGSARLLWRDCARKVS